MSARRYRIRAYDCRGAEIATNREYQLVLDLDGRDARADGTKLDDLAVTLAHTDGARGEEVAGYHLALHDAETDDFVCHWPAVIEGAAWNEH